jgi:hypothetical protein
LSPVKRLSSDNKINKRVEEEKDTKMKCRSLFMFLLIVDLIALFSVSSMNSVKGIQDFTVNHRLHEDESYVWVMGEVINNRDKPAKNVSVAITFLVPSLPTHIKNYYTTAWLGVILPGRRSPFAIHIDKQEVQGYAGCMVEIQHYENSEPKPFGLSLTNDYLYLDSNSSVCSGTVMFNGTVGTKHLIVMACVYDDKGLFDVGSQPIDFSGNLSYGDTTDFGFRALFTNTSSNITSFIVTAESPSLLKHPGYAAYAEKIGLVSPSNEPSQTIDYRVLLPVSAIIAVVIITIIAVRKQKTARVKKRVSTKRESKSLGPKRQAKFLSMLKT